MGHGRRVSREGGQGEGHHQPAQGRDREPVEACGEGSGAFGRTGEYGQGAFASQGRATATDGGAGSQRQGPRGPAEGVAQAERSPGRGENRDERQDRDPWQRNL